MAYATSLKRYTPYGMGAMQYAASGFSNRSKFRHSTSSAYTTTKRRKLSRNTGSFHALAVKELPAKHYANTALGALTHNTINTIIPTTGITQGLTNTNRIGDHVQLCALKIKGSFNTAVAANGYSYRIIIGYTGEEYNLPTVFGSGLSSTELFIANTDANWETNGIINPKAFTVLSDTTYDINSQISAVADCLSYGFTVPLNTKLDYQSNGSLYGKTRNLAIVVIGSVIGGTSGTTSAGLTILAYDLIFK